VEIIGEKCKLPNKWYCLLLFVVVIVVVTVVVVSVVVVSVVVVSVVSVIVVFVSVIVVLLLLFVLLLFMLFFENVCVLYNSLLILGEVIVFGFFHGVCFSVVVVVY